MSSPAIVIVPEVVAIIRLIMRSDVVLPHPDGPTSTVICPEGISRLSSSTATVPSAYRFVTPSNLIKSGSPSGRKASGPTPMSPLAPMDVASSHCTGTASATGPDETCFCLTYETLDEDRREFPAPSPLLANYRAISSGTTRPFARRAATSALRRRRCRRGAGWRRRFGARCPPQGIPGIRGHDRGFFLV